MTYSEAFPDFSDKAPGSDVIQDSDFPWEIAERFFDHKKNLHSPRVRRATSQSIFLLPTTNLGRLNDMARRKTPGTASFSLDISLEAKLRFAGLHDALGFKTKAETFEAIIYAVSTRDKIDAAAVERIERKLDRFLERLDDSI
jgi:hypothetical protein